MFANRDGGGSAAVPGRGRFDAATAVLRLAGARGARSGILWSLAEPESRPGCYYFVIFEGGCRRSMLRFSRSRTSRASYSRWRPPGAAALCVPFRHRAHDVHPDWRPPIGSAMSCGDVDVRPRSRVFLIGARRYGFESVHVPNSVELSACWARISVAGRFVRADVLVIRSSVSETNRCLMVHDGPRGRHERDGCARAAPARRRAEV